MRDQQPPAPANADIVIEGYVDPTEPLRSEGRSAIIPAIIPYLKISRVSHYGRHTSQRCRVPDHNRGATADGGFLPWRRKRRAVPAHLPDEFPGDRGHRPAC